MGIASKSIISNLSGSFCQLQNSDNLHIFLICLIQLIDIDTTVLNFFVSQTVMTPDTF